MVYNFNFIFRQQVKMVVGLPLQNSMLQSLKMIGTKWFLATPWIKIWEKPYNQLIWSAFYVSIETYFILNFLNFWSRVLVRSLPIGFKKSKEVPIRQIQSKTGKNIEINKQLHVKFWFNRKNYGAVLYLLSCTLKLKKTV